MRWVNTIQPPPPKRLDKKPPAKEKEAEIGKYAKAVAHGLEETFKKIARVDAPRLVRNAVAIAVGAMTIYMLGVSVSTMAPYAVPVFAQFGRVIGFMVPVMFMFMMVSLTIAIARIVIGG